MLMAFWDSSMSFQFAWGTKDCCIETAEWVDTSCSLSIADTWRGTYSTEAEAAALLAENGGMVAMVGAELEAAGLTPTDAPVYGDVGVVEINGNAFCSIMTPAGRWRARQPLGFYYVRSPVVLGAWALTCPR